MHDFVYLASQSPRRTQLLDQLGVAHRVLPPEPHEDVEALEHERVGELPAAYVQRVTLAKLQAARRRLAQRALPAAPILAADTTVALGRRILGKPSDAADASTRPSGVCEKNFPTAVLAPGILDVSRPIAFPLMRSASAFIRGDMTPPTIWPWFMFCGTYSPSTIDPALNLPWPS
jgi:hypothetical protein